MHARTNQLKENESDFFSKSFVVLSSWPFTDSYAQVMYGILTDTSSTGDRPQTKLEMDRNSSRKSIFTYYFKGASTAVHTSLFFELLF